MNERRQLFGVEIDSLRLDQAVDQVLQWARFPQQPCRYVVTPNVDHLVILSQNEQFRSAYHNANLVLADGWPVVAAARLLGHPLPERVPGSDLVPAVFEAAGKCSGLRVFLLGAGPGVAARAADNIHQRWPHVKVIDVHSPPRGFESNNRENQHILSRIQKAAADLLVVGLGAPKQEIWVHRHLPNIEAPVALCVGASIDFLAGERLRAPKWVQNSGMEWLHRMACEPKRLCRRYARDAYVFPRLVWRQWWEHYTG